MQMFMSDLHRRWLNTELGVKVWIKVLCGKSLIFQATEISGHSCTNHNDSFLSVSLA